MSNRAWDQPIGDYRIDEDDRPARVLTEPSTTRYTIELGNREFRLALYWEPTEDWCAILMRAECLWELTPRGERKEINARVKAAVVDVFNRRFDRDKQFEREIRARAQRWHDEGY